MFEVISIPNWTGSIRVTNDTPKRFALIDIVKMVTGKKQDYAAQMLRRIFERFPVSAKCTNFTFVCPEVYTKCVLFQF